MTLAMEMQRYVDTHKDDWYADGKADGKAEDARAMLNLNMSPTIITQVTGLSLEQIQALNVSTQPGSSGSTTAPAL